MIDEISLRELIQYHVSAGTQNICILGTTGEAAQLTMPERASVIQICVDEVKGMIPIMAGVGSNNVLDTKAMTIQARDLGCDAGLLVTPYYVKPPPRCLIQHTYTVADLGLPIVVYNVPSRTGVDFADIDIATAAQHDNVVGVKDATGRISRVSALRQHLLEQNVVKPFLLLSGDDATSIQYVLAGGDGCISVTANVSPAAIQEAMVAALVGNANDAYRIDTPLQPLHQDLFCEANPIPVKWACYKLGLISSPFCRPPLDILDPRKESIVEMALRRAGLFD
jgi:4-hydroxy-tetrahydrodipicolinate synthase